MTPDNRRPRGREVLALGAIVLAGAALGFVGLRPIWDVDIFWHIVAGRWIVEHGAFPNVDIFSFADPSPIWYTFQWLYEVVCYAFDSWGGLPAVRLFHAVATGGAFAAFALFTVRFLRSAEGVGRLWPWTLLALMVLFALYADRVRARPHVFNLLFWSIELVLLLTPGAARLARIIPAALLMFVWSNLHAGGSFVFLVAMGSIPAAATAWRIFKPEGSGRWDTAWADPLPAWGAWGALLAAALLSPNWWRGVVQAQSMLGGSEALIDEWLPFWHYLVVAAHPLHYLSGIVPVLALAMLGLAVAARVRLRIEVALVSVALCFLPYRSARFVYFEAFVFVLLLPAILTWWQHKALPRPGRWGAVLASALSGVLLFAAMHLHGPAQFGTFSRYFTALGQDMDERRFPVELDEPLAALHGRNESEPLRLFCLPNWGGYLLYRHFPYVRVLADGRGNFTKEVGDRLHFLYLYRHHARFQDAIERIYTESDADLLVMQQPVFPEGYRPTHWRPLVESRKGSIWERVGDGQEGR
jgi:hypothetical protein